MKKIAFWAAAWLVAWTAAALEYKTVDIRKTGSSPVRETFWAGDSIDFGYALEEDSDAYDLTPWDLVTWELCTYTNPAQLWMGVEGQVDDARAGELSVRTHLPLSVVPEGQYRGYVKGLKVTESNTVASQRVLVEQVVTVRYGQTEYPPDPEDTGDIIAGNAYVRQSALDAEAAARAEKDDLLEGAIKAISGDPAYYGGMVAKTNGLWVVDQQEGRTALEWNGTPVLEATAPTNASETATGAVMVATAPLYVGEVGESNRVATLADVGGGGDSGWREALAAHTNRTDNPHNVTLEQLDGNGELGDAMEEYGIHADKRDGYSSGVEYLDGYGNTISFEENRWDAENGGNVDFVFSRTNAGFRFDTLTPPSWNGVRMATAEDVAELELDIAQNAQGVASNKAGVAAVNDRIESLWGKCRGGWKWPDYFRVKDYLTGVESASSTNEAVPFATNTEYNVVYTLSESSTLRGWLIRPEIVRSVKEWDSILWEPVKKWRGGGIDRTGMPRKRIPSIDPEDLETSGNYVRFKEGVESINGRFAAVKGTLGGYTVVAELDVDQAKQEAGGTVARYVGPAQGSFLAHCYSNVLVAASNGWAATPRKEMGLWVWPDGYGSGTNHVRAEINTNCWVYGMGDFTCVSYHTDFDRWGPGGVYQPLTMVTPRHAVCAGHFKPTQGSNVYWVTKSGGIATNKVVSYYNIRGDLTVARLEHAFDTNEVGTATLLQRDFYEFMYGTTNTPLLGLGGVPCISFDCAERVRVSFWGASALMRGRTEKARRDWELDNFGADGNFEGGEKYEGPYRGNGGAVGGDSGSPSFLIADGKALLLGCFHTSPGGGPMPHKDEVDEVIDQIWNDPERCEEYSLAAGGWYSPDRPMLPK